MDNNISTILGNIFEQIKLLFVALFSQGQSASTVFFVVATIFLIIKISRMLNFSLRPVIEGTQRIGNLVGEQVIKQSEKIVPKNAESVGLLSPFAEERKTILVSSVLINCLALAFPLLMLSLYDRILQHQSIDTLMIYAIAVGIAVAAESVIRVVRSYITAWIAARFEHRATVEVANRFLAQPLHEFERRGTGAVMEDFKSIATLRYHYSGQTFQQLMDLPFTFLYLFVVFLISPWIGLLLAVGFTVFAAITWRTGANAPELIRDQKESDLRRGNFLNELLRNVHTLKSMTMESLMLRRYERLQENSAKMMSRMTYALDMAANIGNIFAPLMTVLVIALGSWLAIHNRLTNGELAACILLGMRSLAPLQRLGGMWAKFQQDQVMREKLSKVLALPSLPPEGDKPEAKDFDKGLLIEPSQVLVDNIAYHFPGSEKNVFEKFSFSVQPGECIALVGSSGGGRSTLLQMMAGIIKPDTGKILIDGVNIDEISFEEVPKHIAYLPQKAVMFEGSLLDNISVFDPERVEMAMHIADELGLTEYVSKMPRGWDTQVGDMASDSLPPGHRQRIAIVRALSSQPGLILFDDASSAMDSEGDAKLLKYLEGIHGKITMVMVSQRPSFLKLADRTVQMNSGQLREGDLGRVIQMPMRGGIEVIQPESVEGFTIGGATEPAQFLSPSAGIYDSISPEEFFSSPYRNQMNRSERWEHIHETVKGSFREETDLSGCLALLLKLLHSRESAREVAESLPYYTDNLDLPGLRNAMAQLGFKLSEFKCRLGEIDARSLPCLFIPDDGPAFVALGRIGIQMRIAYDTSEESRVESDLDLPGRALFYEDSEQSKSISHRSWVYEALIRFAPLIGEASISALVSGAIAVSGSLFLMVAYGTIIPSAAEQTLFYLGFGTAVAVCASYFFVRHRAKILAFIGGRIEYLFGTAILQQVLSMSPTNTERASVGAQTARLQSFEGIRDLFTGPLAATFLELPATLVIIVALSIINPIALIIFLCMIAVYLSLYWFFSSKSEKRVIDVNRTSTKKTEMLIETITKMRYVRECGAQYLWLERIRKIVSDSTMASFKAEQLSSLLVGVSYFVMMFAALLIVSFTTPAVIAQTMPSGALIVSMMLMWRVLTPLQTFFVNMTRIERVRSSVRQINHLMKIPTERQEANSSPLSRGVKGQIEFARVSFRYSLNVDPALIGVEFKVNPGQMVAITGPNGGGKSTVLKMILGMYQPQAGSILLDGVDIRQIDPLELRRLIGYVPQDVQIFRATIAQNLRLARPDATDDEMYQALDMAGALDQVLALPNGIEFRPGDNTNELPLGLKQKINLARAYITRAPIMIFDEPSAGLDSYGDFKLTEALKALKGKSTVIFISHRPSQIMLADTLLVFDKGYLRAAGPPSELLKIPNSA